MPAGKRYTEDSKKSILKEAHELGGDLKADEKIASKYGLRPSTLATWRREGTKTKRAIHVNSSKLVVVSDPILNKLMNKLQKAKHQVHVLQERIFEHIQS